MRAIALILLALLIANCAAPASTLGPSPTAEPTATPEPTVRPTPESTPEPEVGVITFGKKYDRETLQVRGEKDTFRISEEIAWSASLGQPVGATSVHWVIAKVSSGGSETVSYTDDIEVSDPNHDLFANKVAFGILLDGPGGYVMRYTNADGEVLAEGRFRLVR